MKIDIGGQKYMLFKKDESHMIVISPKGNEYKLRIKDGNVSCSCPAAMYRGGCKHQYYIKTNHMPKEVVGMKWQMGIDKANSFLSLLKGKVIKAEICGSIRRKKEFVKDIDIVVIGNADKLLSTIKESIPEIDMSGNRIIRFKYFGAKVDILVTKFNSFGAAVLYRTGPRELNIKMRAIAKAKGMLLNEYGLWERGEKETRKRIKRSNSERGIFEALGMEYIIPERRK